MATRSITKVSVGLVDVHMVPMFDDNYGHLLVDTVTNEALVVDPGDGNAILRAVADLGVQLTTVLCTHKHGDHVGGNAALVAAMPHLQVVATRHEPIPHATTLVGDNDILRIGRLTIRTIFAPCHTAGHVLYFVTPDSVSDSNADTTSPLLFSGDTLFVGGCGRFFEGTAEQMLANMDRISLLPVNTLVFCAHEYTESNYKFLAHTDPALQGKYAEIQLVRKKGLPTIPSVLADELQHNLFMKCRDKKIQQLVGTTSAVDTMQELRNRKNAFK
jgi:hydroxyacylglutathione hydrolase